MKVIHKQKDCNISKNRIQLINDDGTWNVVCGNKNSSSCIANKDWKVVTCKKCLRLK